MSFINRLFRGNRTSRTSTNIPQGGGGSVNSTSSTSSTSSASTSTPTGVDSLDPNAGADVSGHQSGAPIQLDIGGFKGKDFPSTNITLNTTSNNFADAESSDKDGWTTRGRIGVSYQPTTDGVRVRVDSRHTKPRDASKYDGDNMSLYLQMEVTDVKNGKKRVVVLDTMFEGTFNDSKGPTGSRTFDISYDKVQAFLDKETGGKVKFVPGETPLAVMAVWGNNVGHQWGGFYRDNEKTFEGDSSTNPTNFVSPKALGRSSSVDIRAGSVDTGAVDFKTAQWVKKPIDIVHNVPADLQAKYDKVFDKNAKVVSRCEHENKFCPVSVDDLTDKTLELLDVASDKGKAEAWLLQAFGADPDLSKMAGKDVSGWKLSTTDRYYQKDDAGKVMKNAAGLPIVAPMVDVYRDQVKPGYGQFTVGKSSMAMRFRDGEIKGGSTEATMGKLNMKTLRVTNPFTLTQTGIEVSLDTKYGMVNDPDAIKQLGTFLETESFPYSPMSELKKSNSSMSGRVLEDDAVINVANRYKFTLEHESGMELEVSMDIVHAGFPFEKAEPKATKGMDDDAKYDFYAAKFEAGDQDTFVTSTPKVNDAQGERNRMVFEEDGKLIMAVFYKDDNGKKCVAEHPAVRFPQVECEMDHVQARSTSSASSSEQATVVKDSLICTKAKDQADFFSGLSDEVTTKAPPTSHTHDDITDIHAYRDSDYTEMQGAVNKFRTALFDKVKSARQKAAQALEVAGYVEPEKLQLKVEVQPKLNYSQRDQLSVNVSGGDITFKGKGLQTQPGVLSISWNNFPIDLPLKGDEKPEDIANMVQKELDQAVLYKASVEKKGDSFVVKVEERG